jgi:hypothetical protein
VIAKAPWRTAGALFLRPFHELRQLSLETERELKYGCLPRSRRMAVVLVAMVNRSEPRHRIPELLAFAVVFLVLLIWIPSFTERLYPLTGDERF